jgi:hypothetical protein
MITKIADPKVRAWLERRQIVADYSGIEYECTQLVIARFCTACGKPTEDCLSCKVAELSLSIGELHRGA